MKTLLALAPARGFPNPQHVAFAERVRTSPPLRLLHPLRLQRTALPLLLAAPLRAQPLITTPPPSQAVRVGEPAAIHVAATGTPPLTYQPEIRSSKSEIRKKSEARSPKDCGPWGVRSALFPTVGRRRVRPSDFGLLSGFGNSDFGIRDQWRKDGADLAGATHADDAIAQTRAADAGRYTVTVSHATGRVTSDAATLTVHDVVQFSAARSSVAETGRVAVIRVRRGDDGPGTVTVNYATSDGTATSGTLTFGPGEAEKSFTLPLLDDAFPEGDALVAANGCSPHISR